MTKTKDMLDEITPETGCKVTIEPPKQEQIANQTVNGAVGCILLSAYRGLPVAPLAVKNGNLGFPHNQAQMFSHSVVHFY